MDRSDAIEEVAGGQQEPPLSIAQWALLLAAFAVLALGIYRPALGGAFIADDLGYVVNNPFIQDLSSENLGILLDPFGDAATFTANYAPVHLLAHALEFRAFGLETTGYHVVNVLLHALVSALLVALFLYTRLPRAGAILLGTVFLLHPANVEAVAWIFQLKTILSLGLSIGALLAFQRHPLLALLLFALALLAKITAAPALVMAGGLLWSRSGENARIGRGWAWLGAWALMSALCAIAEFPAFDRLGHADQLQPYSGPWEQVRSIVAIGLRYLVMATTSYGVSAFHEPSPASLADPWWLTGVAVLALLGWRVIAVVRRRSVEAAYWAWAFAAFLPVSQVFPFKYPIGDRYLYAILPGLLGGFFFLGREAWLLAEGRLQPAGRAFAGRRLGGGVAAALGALAALLFALHSAARAPLWRSEMTLAVDAARHYPDGCAASLMRARRAAEMGDQDEALAVLRGIADGGFDGFISLQRDPGLVSLHGSPGFDAVVGQVAENWIGSVVRREDLIQAELRMLALAELARGEPQKARERYLEALALGGPLDEAIRGEMASLR